MSPNDKLPCQASFFILTTINESAPHLSALLRAQHKIKVLSGNVKVAFQLWGFKGAQAKPVNTVGSAHFSGHPCTTTGSSDTVQGEGRMKTL